MNVFAYDPPYPLPYDDGTHIYSQFISFYDGNDTPFGNQWYIGGNCQDQSYIDNPSTNDFQDLWFCGGYYRVRYKTNYVWSDWVIENDQFGANVGITIADIQKGYLHSSMDVVYDSGSVPCGKNNINGCTVLMKADVTSNSVISTFQLPDTGQTKCYNTAGTEISCAGTGQDGAYNINPMSYTIIGVNGDMVKDNNTGLIWQRQDDGILYNWYQAEGVYDATLNPTSKNVCSDLGIGWRLPTEKELLTIVDYSIPFPGPVIDAINFPNTKPAYYASSTRNALVSTSDSDVKWVWAVNFSSGGVSSSVYQNGTYVRCVKTGQYPTPSFIHNWDGTVTDITTGLMWQQDNSDGMTWDSALNYCKNLELPIGSGQRDWRVPNIKELAWIVDDRFPNLSNPNLPSIDPTYFPYACAYAYQSSTTMEGLASFNGILQTVAAWLVNFASGDMAANNKISTYCVRCVRGGESVDPPPPPPSACIYTYSDWGACQPDGTQTRAVSTATPAGCTGTPVLSQSCTYIPPVGRLQVSPLKYDFATQAVGKVSNSQTFNLANTGKGNLIIYSIALSDSVNYVLGKTGNPLTDCHINNPLGTVVAGGSSCNFSVKFRPTSTGSHDAYLTISSDDPSASGYVPLTGFAKSGSQEINVPGFVDKQTLTKSSINTYTFTLTEPTSIGILSTGNNLNLVGALYQIGPDGTHAYVTNLDSSTPFSGGYVDADGTKHKDFMIRPGTADQTGKRILPAGTYYLDVSTKNGKIQNGNYGILLFKRPSMNPSVLTTQISDEFFNGLQLLINDGDPSTQYLDIYVKALYPDLYPNLNNNNDPKGLQYNITNCQNILGTCEYKGVPWIRQCKALNNFYLKYVLGQNTMESDCVIDAALTGNSDVLLAGASLEYNSASNPKFGSLSNVARGDVWVKDISLVCNKKGYYVSGANHYGLVFDTQNITDPNIIDANHDPKEPGRLSIIDINNRFPARPTKIVRP